MANISPPGCWYINLPTHEYLLSAETEAHAQSWVTAVLHTMRSSIVATVGASTSASPRRADTGAGSSSASASKGLLGFASKGLRQVCLA